MKTQKKPGRPKSSTVSRRPIMAEEYEDLMMYVNQQVLKPTSQDKLRKAFCLSYYFGTRISELLLLTREDIFSLINSEKGILSLSNATKTKRPRLILVGKKGVQEIRDLFEMEWDPMIDNMKEKVFQGHKGSELGVPGFTKFLNTHIRAGLDSKLFSSHSFRAGIITSMLKNRVDIATVSKFIGHSNVSVTLSYHRPQESDLMEAAELAR